MVSRSTPNMNSSATTALVGRWRPETHNFQLQIGEMTVMIQDMSIILSLPIEGKFGSIFPFRKASLFT
jgi:hypothetical protein